MAALTTPLDVVKTRVQIRDMPVQSDFAGRAGRVSNYGQTTKGGSRGLFTELATLAREGGLRGRAWQILLTPPLLATSPTRVLNLRFLIVMAPYDAASDICQTLLRGLYAGWAFRAGRAGPTCGIVLMAYEMAKTM